MIGKFIRCAVGALFKTLGERDVLWTVGTHVLALEYNKRRNPMRYKDRPQFLFFKESQHYIDLPTITKPRRVPYKIELHEAKRAGTHLDFRILIDGTVYDFAVVKTDEMPTRTGFMQRVVRRHNHSVEYFNTDSYVFPEGSYGEGRMNTIDRGQMDIIMSSPEKIEFELISGPFKGLYCIFTEKSPVCGDAGVMLRMKDNEFIHKDRMAFTAEPRKVEAAYDNSNVIAELKVDGANYMLQKGRGGNKGNGLISRRLSVTGDQINRINNVPQLKYANLPEELTGKVIHCEIVSKDMSVSKTAGLLNSGPVVSTTKQMQDSRSRLVAFAWDVEMKGSYAERKAYLKALSKRLGRIDLRNFGDRSDQFLLKRLTNPRVLLVPVDNQDLKVTPREFSMLFKALGYEGSVLKDQTKGYYQDVWAKDKAVSDMTLKIVGFQQGTGKYSESLGAIIAEKDGVRGVIGTGFTDAQRQDIWNNRDGLIGVAIDVKCHEVTRNNVCRGPRFVDFSL